MESKIIQGDCVEEIKKLPPQSVDLIFGSPPYEDARTYGIDFKLKGQDWVDWMVGVYRACLSRCKGLAAFVVQGRTRKYRWSATPTLLIADLHQKRAEFPAWMIDHLSVFSFGILIFKFGSFCPDHSAFFQFGQNPVIKSGF